MYSLRLTSYIFLKGYTYITRNMVTVIQIISDKNRIQRNSLKECNVETATEERHCVLFCNLLAYVFSEMYFIVIISTSVLSLKPLQRRR